MEIFKNGKKKFVLQEQKLSEITEALRGIGHRIIVTIGTWDMLHIGHLRYLERAKSHGDLLIVGVDSDRAVKIYKGEHRPIVPQEERIEMLCYQNCVDFVTPVDDVEKETGWQYGLIKVVKPDVFIAVEDSYPEDQRIEIKKHCGELVVLPRQAENTSTSQFIQKVVKEELVKIISIINSGKARV